MINTLRKSLDLITKLIQGREGDGFCADQCSENGCPFEYPNYDTRENGPDVDCDLYQIKRWVWDVNPRDLPETYANHEINNDYGLVFLCGREQDMQDLDKWGWRYLTTINGPYPAIVAVYIESEIGQQCIALGDTVEYNSFYLGNQFEKEKEGWIRLGQPINTTGPLIMMRHLEGVTE